MTAEELYEIWRAKLLDNNAYPAGAVLTWGQLPESEQQAWQAVVEATS